MRWCLHDLNFWDILYLKVLILCTLFRKEIQFISVSAIPIWFTVQRKCRDRCW
jgi:hypothetical protein